MELSEELKKILRQNGADLVGIANMDGVANCNYRFGVSVAIAVPKNIIVDLQTAPTKEYHAMYYTYNSRLNEIVVAGERFLQDKGYEAYAQTTDRVQVNEKKISKIPHKTVATRAGLGWIGKNCLLVTPEYGPAIRLSSLLTNAPLICDEAITESRCGKCNLCVRKCPAQALHGALWKTGMAREKIVDVEKCYEKQVEIMSAATGIREDLCGKCFAVCAYTQRYLKKDNFTESIQDIAGEMGRK